MAKLMDRLIGIVTHISEWLDLITEWLAQRSTPVDSAEEGRNMSLEEVVDRISESAARLKEAIERSTPTPQEKLVEEEGKAEEPRAPGSVQEPAAPEPRDENWWALLSREDSNLIKLSWDLRGVILKRGQQQAAKKMGPR